MRHMGTNHMKAILTISDDTGCELKDIEVEIPECQFCDNPDSSCYIDKTDWKARYEKVKGMLYLVLSSFENDAIELSWSGKFNHVYEWYREQQKENK